MLRRVAALVTMTALCTFGMQGGPLAGQGPERQDCGCGGFFYGYADASSPPSFGPIFDGVTVTTYPGQCGGYCAGWAYVAAAGLCSYQPGTVAVYGTWGYSSPSGSGDGFVTEAECS